MTTVTTAGEKALTQSRSVQDSLAIIFIIVTVTLIWVFVIPGIVAYREQVFYTRDIETKIPKHSTSAVSSYDSYRKNQEAKRQAIAVIEVEISNLLQRKENNLAIENLNKLRQTYKDELANLKAPITLSSYTIGRTLYYTFVAYIFLGVSVCLLMPIRLRALNLRKIVLVGVAIYVGWMFTSWIRNFVVYDEGRTIFSFVNYDIGPRSFLLQEMRILVMSIFISALWQGWIKYFEVVREQVKNNSFKPQSLSSLSEYSYSITQMFNRWQLNSIALLGAFLPWTFLYWSNIVNYGDNRYLIPAFVVHIYWMVSWGLTTIPLIHAYNSWTAKKAKCLSDAADSSNEKEPERSINLTREINPITTLEVFGAGLATVISFLLPFKDLVF